MSGVEYNIDMEESDIFNEIKELEPDERYELLKLILDMGYNEFTFTNCKWCDKLRRENYDNFQCVGCKLWTCNDCFTECYRCNDKLCRDCFGKKCDKCNTVICKDCRHYYGSGCKACKYRYY